MSRAPFLHPRLEGGLTFSILLQPPIRPELISIFPKYALVATDDIGVHADERSSWDVRPVGKVESAFGDDTFHCHADSGVVAKSFVDHGFEVGSGAGFGDGDGFEGCEAGANFRLEFVPDALVLQAVVEEGAHGDRGSIRAGNYLIESQ